MVLSHVGDAARERRALWLRAGLLLLGVLLFALAGVHSARAESPDAALFPKILPLPNGFAPEGIAIGRGTDFYVGSLAGGAIYKGYLRTGEGAISAQPVSGRAITGLKVDKRTNYVFAAGATSGKAYVFDGSTGAQLAEYQLATATPTFINDEVVTRDAVYFTDSNQPFIYKLPLGPGGQLPAASAVVRIPLSGDYQMVPGFNANGIDAPYNGRVLIIVQSATGFLFSVDPATGYAAKIDLGGATVVNGDGILLDGRRLYVVQNQDNKIAVIDLKPARNAGTIVKYITDPAFRVPTTIAQFGPWLYAVNARFGTPVTPDTEYEAVRVNK